MAGATPNYTTHLLRRYRPLALYGARDYFLGWISVPAMNAIILADLIDSNLQSLGIQAPVMALRTRQHPADFAAPPQGDGNPSRR